MLLSTIRRCNVLDIYMANQILQKLLKSAQWKLLYFDLKIIVKVLIVETKPLIITNFYYLAPYPNIYGYKAATQLMYYLQIYSRVSSRLITLILLLPSHCLHPSLPLFTSESPINILSTHGGSNTKEIYKGINTEAKAQDYSHLDALLLLYQQ